ncbi:FAD:protein FMN transferase [Agitococcus lubricus]|uniref:FAD:protein FMN transferase n=1 Tax=Agitococcus lubricus TaxID=1077255 RepID=A0A2T5J1X7_9GAMM|nr:FAD:protein FMN transferase [Agitococcus lubricus]PTQ90446.1 thiamine biosynthesis lipoprotein [Agitococcus lubricus]
MSHDRSYHVDIRPLATHWQIHFEAMASLCEVLVDTDDENLVHRIARIASQEAWRIEEKFSRYRQDNIVYKINQCQGGSVTVDDETAELLDFAAQCYTLSGGMFDVTSGILRRVWRFDGSDLLANPEDVDALLAHIGWDKVRWNKPTIALPFGMELDFGGIGKEYAVDKVWQLISEHCDASVLINFGGDLRVTAPRRDGSAWQIGLENPEHTDSQTGIFSLSQGALATSGDSKRFLLKDGVRYSHILNPLTGWPITDAPHSVTVAAPTCIEAGMMATFASLQGTDAEIFLDAMEAPYWCLR